jgi:hypothetical protein
VHSSLSISQHVTQTHTVFNLSISHGFQAAANKEQQSAVAKCEIVPGQCTKQRDHLLAFDNHKCAITRACVRDPVVQRAHAECAEECG